VETSVERSIVVRLGQLDDAIDFVLICCCSLHAIPVALEVPFCLILLIPVRKSFPACVV
jgi:hypothetical protein